jgi:hypothetical protein
LNAFGIFCSPEPSTACRDYGSSRCSGLGLPTKRQLEADVARLGEEP